MNGVLWCIFTLFCKCVMPSNIYECTFTLISSSGLRQFLYTEYNVSYIMSRIYFFTFMPIQRVCVNHYQYNLFCKIFTRHKRTKIQFNLFSLFFIRNFISQQMTDLHTRTAAAHNLLDKRNLFMQNSHSWIFQLESNL